MNAPLYTLEILRLAASIPEPRPLERVDGAADERSPTCGSRVRTEVQLDADGAIVALSQQIQACAFGQAATALVALSARGRNTQQVSEALGALTAWLSGEREDTGRWPGLAALAPARARTGRHGAILLPFRALLTAMREAAR